MPTKIPEGLSCTVTQEIKPEEAYAQHGKVPMIPDGYEFEEFGPVKAGMLFLQSTGDACLCARDHPPTLPRIIVRRKPVKPRRFIVEFPDYPEHDFKLSEKSPGCPRFTVCREVKPITRGQIEHAWLCQSVLSSPNQQKAEIFLQELGIEVEG